MSDVKWPALFLSTICRWEGSMGSIPSGIKSQFMNSYGEMLESIHLIQTVLQIPPVVLWYSIGITD